MQLLTKPIIQFVKHLFLVNTFFNSYVNSSCTLMFGIDDNANFKNMNVSASCPDHTICFVGCRLTGTDR